MYIWLNFETRVPRFWLMECYIKLHIDILAHNGARKSAGRELITIPWICYERSFSEFYLPIWNRLVFNQKASVVCSVTAAICFDFCLKTHKRISKFRRTNHQEMKYWLTFCVNHFLRYYLMIPHQLIVKAANERQPPQSGWPVPICTSTLLSQVIHFMQLIILCKITN